MKNYHIYNFSIYLTIFRNDNPRTYCVIFRNIFQSKFSLLSFKEKLLNFDERAYRCSFFRKFLADTQLWDSHKIIYSWNDRNYISLHHGYHLNPLIATFSKFSLVDGNRGYHTFLTKILNFLKIQFYALYLSNFS